MLLCRTYQLRTNGIDIYSHTYNASYCRYNKGSHTVNLWIALIVFFSANLTLSRSLLLSYGRICFYLTSLIFLVVLFRSLIRFPFINNLFKHSPSHFTNSNIQPLHRTGMPPQVTWSTRLALSNSITLTSKSRDILYFNIDREPDTGVVRGLTNSCLYYRSGLHRLSPVKESGDSYPIVR